MGMPVITIPVHAISMVLTCRCAVQYLPLVGRVWVEECLYGGKSSVGAVQC